MKNHSFNLSEYALIIVMLVLSLVLAWLPATRVMGYESAWISTLGFVIIGAPLTMRARGWVIGLSLFTPLLIALLNAFRVTHCDLPSSVAWYGVLLAPSAGLALTLMRGLRRFYSIRQAATRYYAILTLCLIAQAYRLYDGPMIQGYDLLLGYFAGSLYDESLPISHALLWHQLLVTLIAVGLNLMMGKRASSLRIDSNIASKLSLKKGIGGACLGAALIISWQGHTSGFRTTRSDLIKALPRTLVTPHLIIHYAAQGDFDRSSAKRWPEAEMIAEQVAKQFPHQSAPAEPTHLYLYDKASDKARLIGAKETLFTRPWRREIHYHDDHDLSALAHELAHIEAAALHPGFPHVPMQGLWPQPALIEGLAVAIEENVGSPYPSLDMTMAALKAAGHLPDLRQLMASPAYFYGSESSDRAYLATGAFVHYWMTHQGAETLYAAYASGREPDDTAEWITRYEAFLDSVKIPSFLKKAIAEQYQSRALHLRVCGRDMALLQSKAREALRRGQFQEGIGYCSQIEQREGSNPRLQMLKIALLKAEFDSNRTPNKLVNELDRLLKSADTRIAVKQRAAELRADIEMSQHQTTRAAEFLADAHDWAIDSNELRQIEIKQFLTRCQMASIYQTITQAMTHSQAITHLQTALKEQPKGPCTQATQQKIVHYLLGRRLLMSAHQEASPAQHQQAQIHLQEALPIARMDQSDLPISMLHESRRLLIETLIDDRQLSKAHDALLQWQKSTDTRVDAQALQSQERLAARYQFYASHPTW